MNKYSFTFEYACKFNEDAEIMISGFFSAGSQALAEKITKEICEIYSINGLVDLGRLCNSTTILV